MLIQLPDQPGWRKPKWVVRRRHVHGRDRQRLMGQLVRFLWWDQSLMFTYHPATWFTLEEAT